MIEKRSGSRVIFKVKTIIKFNKSSFEGKIVNISLQGMLIQGIEKIPANTNVKAEICMEGDTSHLAITVMGYATRSDDNGVAIVFKEIDIDSYIHLKNIIAYNEDIEE